MGLHCLLEASGMVLNFCTASLDLKPKVHSLRELYFSRKNKKKSPLNLGRVGLP